MSLMLSGRVSRVTTRDVTNTSQPFVETTYVVEDWGQTFYVTRTKNCAGESPEEGVMAEFDVYVRAYVKKTGEAGFGLQCTAVRPSSNVEQLNQGKRSA